MISYVAETFWPGITPLNKTGYTCHVGEYKILKKYFVSISAVAKMVSGLTGRWGLYFATAEAYIENWARVILFFKLHIQ